MEMDICQLEIVLGQLADPIQISTNIEGEIINLGMISSRQDNLRVNEEFLTVKEKKDKRTRLFYDNKSVLVNALIRAALLRPRLEKVSKVISHWDDVILGLDTNLFYTCLVTSSLLNAVMRIPSGDFIDSPDWLTLVVSKVAMNEIENRANHSDKALHRRESLRAIQEIMILHMSKDLEGVSLFLTGQIPPEIDFSRKETASIRDSTIREHFRQFLKSLDFYKGAYFLTQDFNNSVLAEAEGLNSIYIRKPKLEVEYDLASLGVNISEVVYELAVAFDPLFLQTENMKMIVHSDWEGKNLQDWEAWKISIENDFKVNALIDQSLDTEMAHKIHQGWKVMETRFIHSIMS